MWPASCCMLPMQLLGKHARPPHVHRRCVSCSTCSIGGCWEVPIRRLLGRTVGQSTIRLAHTHLVVELMILCAASDIFACRARAATVAPAGRTDEPAWRNVPPQISSYARRRHGQRTNLWGASRRAPSPLGLSRHRHAAVSRRENAKSQSTERTERRDTVSVTTEKKSFVYTSR